MRYMAMNSKAVEKFIEKLTQQGYTVEKINERVLETGRRAVFLSKLVVRW
jgi:biotin operon repressor